MVLKYYGIAEKVVFIMIVKLLGVEGVDYTKKDGTSVIGLKFYVSRNFSINKKNVKGVMTEDIYISSRSPLFEKVVNYDVGKEYRVDYEVNGKFSQLIDIIPLASSGASNDTFSFEYKE